MNRIEELRAAMQAALDGMVAIEEAAASSGEWTEAQTKKHSDLQAEFDKAEAEHDRLVATQERRNRLAQPTGRRTAAGALVATAVGAALAGSPANAHGLGAADIGRVERRIDALDTNGFESVVEFAHSVRAAAMGTRFDERLTAGGQQKPSAAGPSTYQNEGTGEDGGFLVPPQFRAEIWNAYESEPDLVNWIPSEPTASNAVDLNADETMPWSSEGIQAYWRGENDQMTPTKGKFQKRLVQIHELYAFVAATSELMEDAPRMRNRLTTKAAEAISWKASDALINGSGVGQPLGFNGHASQIEIAKESGQNADTVVVQNVVNMYARLLRMGGSARGALWLANPDCLPQIVLMTLNNHPIFIPYDQGIKGAPDGTLLGLPIRWSEHCQTLGDAGDLQLVAPRGYMHLRRNSVKFDESIHLWFDFGQTAFRWMFRMGGQPMLSAPVTPPNSSATKSHFIRIAARA